MPAHGAYVACSARLTASLAARCDLTIDEIEDLRLAVDEACALLLPRGRPGPALDLGFALAAGELAVSRRASPPVRRRTRPQSASAWTVLAALAGSVGPSTSMVSPASPDHDGRCEQGSR